MHCRDGTASAALAAAAQTTSTEIAAATGLAKSVAEERAQGLAAGLTQADSASPVGGTTLAVGVRTFTGAPDDDTLAIDSLTTDRPLASRAEGETTVLTISVRDTAGSPGSDGVTRAAFSFLDLKMSGLDAADGPSRAGTAAPQVWTHLLGPAFQHGRFLVTADPSDPGVSDPSIVLQSVSPTA